MASIKIKAIERDHENSAVYVHAELNAPEGTIEKTFSFTLDVTGEQIKDTLRNYIEQFEKSQEPQEDLSSLLGQDISRDQE